jgi:CheY-like chemotaxis protein
MSFVRRVLVVEDEALIASMIVEWLGELGCEALGPAASLSVGFTLAQSEPMDAAILDVNINSERVYPLADYLRGRGIPVVFATGYGESVAEIGLEATVLEKPFTSDQLARALDFVFTTKGDIQQ